MGVRGLLRAVVLGYVLGTLPSADVVSRVMSGGAIDLRRSGSGNPGAMNAFQVMGPKAGYAVLAADIGKGVAASVAGRALAGSAGGHLAGSAAVVGHCFPAHNRFRGGKGVGASVGQCLANFPAYFPLDLGVAAVTAANPRWKQRAFTATLAASVCWVAAGLLWWRRGWSNLWGPTPTGSLPLSAALSSSVIAYRFATAVAPAAVSPRATPPRAIEPVGVVPTDMRRAEEFPCPVVEL